MSALADEFRAVDEMGKSSLYHPFTTECSKMLYEYLCEHKKELDWVFGFPDDGFEDEWNLEFDGEIVIAKTHEEMLKIKNVIYK